MSTADGFESLVLTSPGGLEAEFVPSVGMVGCSLRDAGAELLGRRGGLKAYAETGSSFGIPLLAPWANRLDGMSYDAAGRHVDLDAERSPLRLDGGGLPIHGLLTASPLWEVTDTAVGADGARISARLDFAAQDELLAAFPFPHALETEVVLSDRTLAVQTTLRPAGDVAVPVSFGYHPYLQLPDVERATWEVTMPVRRRALLDGRGIPTGQTVAVEPDRGSLEEREFDDLFVELEGDRPRFELAGGGRRLSVTFERGYPVGQVYSPADAGFICFEPMTAPTNALVTGGPELPLAEPGSEFQARFSISVQRGGSVRDI